MFGTTLQHDWGFYFWSALWRHRLFLLEQVCLWVWLWHWNIPVHCKTKTQIDFLWSVLLTLTLVTDLGTAMHKVYLRFISHTSRNWAGPAAVAVRFSSPLQSFPSQSSEVWWGTFRTAALENFLQNFFLIRKDAWYFSASGQTGNSTSITKLGACLSPINSMLLFPFNYSPSDKNCVSGWVIRCTVLLLIMNQ